MTINLTDKIQMKEAKIYNVTDKIALPSMGFENYPEEGDPLEIDKEMYFVCEIEYNREGHIDSIGVIPLVVKNPRNVKNIKNYINCLSVAHRRVRFRKGSMTCDFDECDEMIVS